jgi:pimeloyl-ACP methyl ester carboxylesterase
MGGVIATDLALFAPDRIDRLILVDAPILYDPRSWFRLGIETATEARRFSPRLIPLLVTDAFRAGPFTLSRASRATHLRNLQLDLSIITAPTLVLWGEYDRMFPPTYGQEVAAALPNATFAMCSTSCTNTLSSRKLACSPFSRLA